MSWLRQLVTDFSPLRPEFNPNEVCVGFVEDKVAKRQVSSYLFGLHFAIIIPPTLHTYISSAPGTISQFKATVPMNSVSADS
jgi:hypothetical protein